ncbi:MAG: M1 family metallopeptidase [Clostridia bacterium]|nr:M1 family metallopeptidase [Clostridia bacterium]
MGVTLSLQFRNDTGGTLTDLVLRTWANAYAREETSPAAIDELYDICYPEGFSPGALTLEGIWWNGVLVPDHKYLDAAQTALSVPIPALETGLSGTLLLRCRITVPECAHRFGQSKGVWQFGNALPILSVYENGAWRTDGYCAIGDPFVSECANYSVKLTAPAGWQCAAGATVTYQNGVYTMYAPAVRDFTFALSRDWHSAAVKVKDITVTAHAENASAAKRAAKYAAQAIQVYEKLYGDYPWTQLTLCEADFPLGGMEYPGFILLDKTYFYEDWADTLELLIAHEAAHQWFYALVGSDQYNAPWQDEALSEYAMLRYVLDRYGRTAYENLILTRIDAPMQENILSPVTPGSPIDHFGSYSDYSAVVYGRGAAMMLAVQEMTGKADDFLRAYCDRYAFDLASREDFTSFLNAWSGMDLSPLVLDYIDTYMN